MISSLKQGQELMDARMTMVTDNVQLQMNAMNTTLANLQNTMLRLVGVPESDIRNQNCAMSANTQVNLQLGTQPVPPRGLDEL